jgi:hypothetical protein
VGVYTNSTSCTGDATSDLTCGGSGGGTVFSVSLGAIGFQTGGPRICGKGKGFTPGGKVSIAYFNVPVSNDLPQNRVVGTADASGNVTFTDNNQMSFVNFNCTDDQRFSTVTALVTDDATGDTLTATNIPPCMWCGNALCPTEVGGGICP